MVAKVAIVISTLTEQLATLAEAEKKGIELAGGSADIFQLPDILTTVESEKSDDEVATEEGVEEGEGVEKVEMAKSTKFEYPLADKDTLLNYQSYLFGIPTNLGSIPTQWAQFWDRTGGLWAQGAYNGKVAGLFVTSAGYGDGQETTIKSVLNYLTHHGIIYIPLGYKNVFAEIANIEEVHGGTAWGAGTLCGPDGTREPSELELKIAQTQGKTFYEVTRKFNRSSKPDEEKKSTAKADGAKRSTQKTAEKPAEEKKSSGLKDACCVVM